jgi:hypothetical protein
MSQTLLMETLNVGHFMGFSIELGGDSSQPYRGGNVAFCATLIGCLLESGFTYVTTEGGKLMASLASSRSMLKLLEVRSLDSLREAREARKEAADDIETEGSFFPSS